MGWKKRLDEAPTELQRIHCKDQKNNYYKYSIKSHDLLKQPIVKSHGFT